MQDRYQIKVKGWIDQRWADWFGGLVMTYEGTMEDAPRTVLTGQIPDQAALRGILSRIWNLNLSLLSVKRLEMDAEEEHLNLHDPE